MVKKPTVQPSKDDRPQKSPSAGTFKSVLRKKTAMKEVPVEVQESMVPGGSGFMNSQSTNGNVHARISQRAYELFHCRGGHPGQDLDDWLAAEQEILAKDISS